MRSLTIKTILIDFDGTLIDSIKGMYKAYEELLSNYGETATKKEFNSLNGPSTHEIVDILKKKYIIDDSAEEIYYEYMKLIEKQYINSSPFADSESFLSELTNCGVNIVLVTSNHSSLCLPMVRKFGWQKYIKEYKCGDDIQHSKPNPSIYLAALQQSSIDKNLCIAIEDSINGVKSASSAGLKVFALSKEYRASELLDAGASQVFENLTSILTEVGVC